MDQESDADIENEELTKLKQGTYSDILFVLLPFLAILLQRLWSGEVEKILLGYELSTAAAILGGLSISKFIQGLVAYPSLGVNKERLVFIIALTIFCVVVPSLILTMKLVSTDEAPEIVAYIQPVLMIVAVSLYISAIRIVKSFEATAKQDKSTTAKQQEAGDVSLNQIMSSEVNSDAKT